MLIKLVSSTAISEEGMGKQVKETLVDNKGLSQSERKVAGHREIKGKE